MNNLNSKPNLATKNIADFTIHQDGKAFISQRKTAQLTGIPRSTVNRWVADNGTPENLNENNQLDVKLFNKIVKMGRMKGIDKCEVLTDKLVDLGTEVFMHQQAGFTIVSRNEDLEFELTEMQLELAAISDRQPHHKDSLAGITGKKRHEVKPDYDYLCSVGLLTREPVYSRKYVYQPTDKAIKMGLVTGAKQKTLLFSQKIIKVLKYQLALPV